MENTLTYFDLENKPFLAYNRGDMKSKTSPKDIKAIFFDMDGVLVDSMKYHLKSWKKIFENFNINVSDSFIFEHEGAMAPEIIKCLFKDNGHHLDDKQIFDIYVTQNSIFGEDYLPQVNLYPGSLPLLKQLKAKEVKLGLVTSSRRNLIDRIWKEEELKLFSTIVSADDIKRFKPFPDPYLKAMSQIDQEAGNCLVIENAPAGIEAANSAGITCLAITSTLPEEKLARAQYVFPNLESLSTFLNFILS